ncbi:MAG: hypothetical protein KBT46_08065 [Ruminococcus sp.]|nr:hypothetical protein [Candidatus Copronaster equi]
MKKTDVQITVLDQKLLLLKPPQIASGGQNEDTVKFTFSEHWDGMAKTAIFYRDVNEVYSVSLTNDECLIPAFVLTTEGTLFISVYGKNGNEVRTSDVLELHIKQGAITDAPDPLEGYKNQVENELTTQLATALSEITEQNYTDYTFAQLIGIIADLSSGAVEKLTNALNSIKTEYELETVIDSTDVDSLIVSMISMFDELVSFKENLNTLLDGMVEILEVE